MKNDVKFKDTVMGKITKGAIISWSENDKKGEKATNKKTYGLEIAAINGLVELTSKEKEISEEEKKALSDQVKHDSYRNEIPTPKDAKSDYAWHYERKI